jgi:type IV secretory pathway VirB10-like protein
MDNNGIETNPGRSILRSRWALIAILATAFLVTFFISYSVTSFALNRNSKNTSIAKSGDSKQTDPTQNPNADQPSNNKNETPAPAPAPTPTPSPAPTPTPTPSPGVYCGVSGMPEGVCKAIDSIEKNGLKNNPYVSADTSTVPTELKVTISRSTWKLTNADTGSVSFDASLNGTNYKGSGIFTKSGNDWKVSSYTLSN